MVRWLWPDPGLVTFAISFRDRGRVGSPARQATAPAKGGSHLLSQKEKAGWLFVAPAVLLILLVAIYPVTRTVWLSFHRYSLLHPVAGMPFAGLGNYRTLWQDKHFWAATRNTVVFAMAGLGMELILGLFLALVMNSAVRGRGLVRAAVLVPWAVPTVVSATMWLWLYNDQWGLVNVVLKRLHLIADSHAWLADSTTALPAVIIADVWKTTPFMALVLLAGLQVIPHELYEAADVDGASSWQQFRHVTLPLLRPAILVGLLFRTLDSFRVFDLVYVLTFGGPGNRTEVLSLYAYKVFFRSLDFGYGSAVTVALFGIVALASLLYVRVLGARR